MLVTLQQAYAHLRITEDDAENDDLALKIQAASEAVMAYLKWTDIPDVVPARVKQAVLLELGDMYLNREGEKPDAIPDRFGYGYLSPAATALLYSLRDPSLA